MYIISLYWSFFYWILLIGVLIDKQTILDNCQAQGRHEADIIDGWGQIRMYACVTALGKIHVYNELNSLWDSFEHMNSSK